MKSLDSEIQSFDSEMQSFDPEIQSLDPEIHCKSGGNFIRGWEPRVKITIRFNHTAVRMSNLKFNNLGL